MPAPMAAAMIQGSVPLACAGGTLVDGSLVDGTVVDGPDVVVVVTAEDALKATTRSAAGARKRPAPTDGVGKWLAGAPIVACSRTAPEEASRP